MPDTLIERTVFVVSDSTGITDETFSNSVLSQFEQVSFESIRIPFIDTVEKAEAVAKRINQIAEERKHRTLVFSTLVNPEISPAVRQANCTFMDLFCTFVQHIDTVLGVKSNHSVGRSHMCGLSK